MLRLLLSGTGNFVRALPQKVICFIQAVGRAIQQARLEARTQTRTLVAPQDTPCGPIPGLRPGGRIAGKDMPPGAHPGRLAAQPGRHGPRGIRCRCHLRCLPCRLRDQWNPGLDGTCLHGRPAKSRREDRVRAVCLRVSCCARMACRCGTGEEHDDLSISNTALTATEAYLIGVRELPDCGRLTELQAMLSGKDWKVPVEMCSKAWGISTPQAPALACTPDQADKLKGIIAEFERDIPQNASLETTRSWYNTFKTQTYPILPNCASALEPKRIMVYMADEVFSIATLADARKPTEIHEQMKADLEQQLATYR